MRSDPTARTSVVVRVAGREVVLAAGQALVVGRDPLADVQVEHPGVSRRHVRLQHAGEHLLVVDLGARAGTFVDGEPLEGTCVADLPVRLRLGGEGAPEIRVEAVEAVAGAAREEREPGHPSLSEIGDTLVIGRAQGCDLHLPDDFLVSKHHARVVLEQGGPVVHDLDSRNGTFVNGQRVTRAPLGVHDEVSVGRHRFSLRAGMLRPRSEDGQITFAARGLGFALPSGRQLLDDISFTLPRASLLAVVGPSGAGKSTLLGTLTGAQAATTGQVLYDGHDLHSRIEELRDRIGVVPQQDIVHGALTVRQALAAAAELRFPLDLEVTAKTARIEEVVDELGLTMHADTRVSALSGGQRKRASVAMELLTKPSLLFLDEPTSGLDPGMDEQLMRTLRRLADSGRTVIVITHSTASLELCDRLLFLAPGGRTAYFGPPEDALESLDARDFAKAFTRVEREPDEVVERFRRSTTHRSMVETPLGTLDDLDRAAVPAAVVPDVGDVWRITVHQARSVLARQLRVMAADRPLVLFLAAMPLVVALLALLVPGDQGLAAAGPGQVPTGQAQQMLLVMTLGAVFMGLTGSIRELVGERAIFVRERSVGLRPVAYLAAKTAVLGGVAVLQCLVMLAIVLAFRAGPPEGVLLPGAAGSFVELFLALAATTVCCTVLGLLISAFLRTSAQAMPLIVVLVMTLLVLSGGLFALADRDALDAVSWLAPSRWGYASMAGTVDLNVVSPTPDDQLWTHGAWTLTRSVLVLGGMTLVLAVATGWRLARRYRDR